MDRVRILLFASDGDLYWLSEHGQNAHIHLPWGYVQRGKCLARNAVLYALRRSLDREEISPQEIFVVPFFAPEHDVSLHLPRLSDEDREGAFRYTWEREESEGVLCGAVYDGSDSEWVLLGVDKTLAKSWTEALDTLDCPIHIKPWSLFTKEFLLEKERPYCFVGWEGFAFISSNKKVKSELFTLDYRGSSEDDYSPMELDEILSERTEDSKAYEDLKRKWAICCMMGLSEFRQDVDLSELECSSRMSREAIDRLSLTDTIFGIDPTALPISFPSNKKTGKKMHLPSISEFLPLLFIIGTILGCFYHFAYLRHVPQPSTPGRTFSIKNTSLPGVVSCTYKQVGNHVQGKAVVRSETDAKAFLTTISKDLKELEIKQQAVQNGIFIEFFGMSAAQD